MTKEERYTTPKAVEVAIATAAKQAFVKDQALTIQERIRLEHFHRFLSRVFSEVNEPNWVLKGGIGMLARVASTRATRDVDLFRRNSSLDSALKDLRRLAGIDLGDFFQFIYTGHSDIVGENQQSATEGYRVNFEIYLGGNKKDTFHVDLVVDVVITDDIEIATPTNALNLPKLMTNPYHLYPVADQIADKVCATIALYDGRPSSREKDLVDLVALAVTQDISLQKLRRALESESCVRSLTLPTTFKIPDGWGASYSKLASSIPACASYLKIDSACELMHTFIDPVFSPSGDIQQWDHTCLSWVKSS